MMSIEFRRWQKYWKTAVFQLRRKLRDLTRRGIAVLKELSPGFDLQSGYVCINLCSNHKHLTVLRTVYDLIPPHVFFTPREIAVWRNMASWMMPEDIVDITLPGPAEFWPEDYDFEKHGFYMDTRNKANYEEAYAMVFVEEEPKRYGLIFLLDNELRVMEDTAEAQMIQRIML